MRRMPDTVLAHDLNETILPIHFMPHHLYITPVPIQ